jgi:hypothetical protein
VSETQVTDGRISAIRPRSAWVACFENYRAMERETSLGLVKDASWKEKRILAQAA